MSLAPLMHGDDVGVIILCIYYSLSKFHPRHNLSKNIFACLFSGHIIISLLCHEVISLMMLGLETCFSRHRETQMIILRIFMANSGPKWDDRTYGPG